MSIGAVRTTNAKALDCRSVSHLRRVAVTGAGRVLSRGRVPVTVTASAHLLVEVGLGLGLGLLQRLLRRRALGYVGGRGDEAGLHGLSPLGREGDAVLRADGDGVLRRSLAQLRSPG